MIIQPLLEPFILHNEKALLREIAGGDETAFRVLYDHYRNKVITIAYKMVHSHTEAMDILQDIFEKLWMNRHKLSEVDNFNAYLNTVTRNHIYNILRKKLLEASLLSEMEDIAEAEQPDPVVQRQWQQILHTAIHQLPTQQQKVFELSRIEGLRQSDIAEQLHISRETVKRHLAEAGKNLRNILGTVAKTFMLLLLHFFQ